jgi:hypothetical protein
VTFKGAFLRGYRCDSVAGYLLSILKILNLIPNRTKKTQKKPNPKQTKPKEKKKMTDEMLFLYLIFNSTFFM